ncbi:bifunctional diaminohydroxyphosphoribosylaminopyrimidine deaminase/5-amino-6-(5-phosphoribosylamino)uracil reductase RibD [Aristophania vespae]|uniref:Riboflavin biosynthesis protein RibD n=1 Tax=Aristophania vespae TaxID=2697033 RepID=A0A6P1NFI0_9PROT|nr:bifunctional diaminohydroxyphosphoribosylaminopyrimidine deaminase/5-amino-6-(5-phosphoribosylamino)uracil reductase RibD [Aristophania vespae]QHI96198.1 bifunctional diaminohydroxyphosphoribosylaminopyrimidine deaminase/5-amino-6-(5-phosphoribosylamino)uracil reductase RibD [Aristophania vespae]
MKTQSLSILPSEAVRHGFKRALSLAARTVGATAPNPSVGCTLLDKDGNILAVGAHPKAGESHAEVVALEAARAAGLFDKIYAALVTLEPCAHYGRTPPCALKLKESPVKEVWIGFRDPNPLATGGGDVLTQGEPAKQVFYLEDMPDYEDLAKDCHALLMPFLTRILKKRPWLTVKQALNKNGTMYPPQGQVTFTSPSSLKLAHQLRRATDAVITAIGTVLADDPSFTVRHVEDHSERHARLLIVLDRHKKMPISWKKDREESGFLVEACSDLEEAENLLRQYQANWALIEAGPTLLQIIKDHDFWDEWLTIQQNEGTQDDSQKLLLRDPENGDVSPLNLLKNYGGE